MTGQKVFTLDVEVTATQWRGRFVCVAPSLQDAVAKAFATDIDRAVASSERELNGLEKAMSFEHLFRPGNGMDQAWMPLVRAIAEAADGSPPEPFWFLSTTRSARRGVPSVEPGVTVELERTGGRSISVFGSVLDAADAPRRADAARARGCQAEVSTEFPDQLTVTFNAGGSVQGAGVAHLILQALVEYFDVTPSDFFTFPGVMNPRIAQIPGMKSRVGGFIIGSPADDPGAIETEERSAPPREMTLEDVDFSGADLTNTSFRHAVFQGSNLRGARAHGAEFDNVFFGDSILDGVDWTNSMPGWADTDSEVTRAFFETFQAEDMTLPYVPDDYPYTIEQLGEQYFGSPDQTPLRPMDFYMFRPAVQQILDGDWRQRFAVGMAGHGMNSYAWTYLCVEGQVAVVGQVGRGLMYRDRQQQTNEWDQLMQSARHVFDHASHDDEERMLLVAFSEMRSIAQWSVLRQTEAGVVVEKTSPERDVRADPVGFFRSAVAARPAAAG